MALKFRRGTTAQKSGSLAYGEPYVNTTLGTLQVGGQTGDITLLINSSSTGISGSSLDITGNAKIDGNLTLGGNITIGDATSDTIKVTANLSSSLIPSVTNAFDLGSSDKIWRDLYISTGSIKFVDGTSVVNTFSSNTLTTILQSTGSSDARFTEIGVVSGSLIASASANTISVSNLNTFSGSQLTQNTALATITGSLISTASANTQRLTAMEAVSGSWVTEAETASFARTNATNVFTTNQVISGGLDVTGTITANEFHTTFVTSSVMYNSGSNRFGDSADDLQQLIGIVEITGSIKGNQFNDLATITGSLIASASSFENRNANLATITGSLISSASSFENRNASLATISGSLISTASNHEQRLAANEVVSSSYARTNASNTFNNDQIISGSIELTGRVRAALALSASVLHIHTTDGNSQIELENSTTGRGFHLISYNGNSFSIHEPILGKSIFRIDSGSQYHSNFFGDVNVLTGSVSSSVGFSGSINGIGNVTAFSSSVVSQFSSLQTRATEIGVVSGSLISSASAAKTTNDSQDVSITNLNTFSGSQLTQNTNLATITGSLIVSASNLTQRVAAVESVSGTFARTNSANIFTGNQTITGSMYVSGDLIVQGSSSLQNISASAVDIGTNIILLNTDTPAVRFAGLSVFDSGSTAGTGSLFWDSENERWIYQKASGSSYSGGMLISGPRNNGALGEEVGMPTNKLIIGIGGDHISSSNIYHNGIDTSFPGNVEVTGSFKASLTGNATTATTLETARLINGTSFNGSSDITIQNLVSGSSQIVYANISSIPGGIISGSSQLSGTVIPNLSGSFTGSFNGNLSGVAAYASTIATVTTNTTTDTTLYPMFSLTPSPNSYITPTTHPSGSFYYNGVTRKVYGETFVGAIEATNGVVSGSSQIAFSGVTGTVSNAQLANSTISGISLGSNLGTLTIGTGLSGTSYNGSTGVTIGNTGVLSITTNTGLNTNVSTTGDVTITNTGVRSIAAGTGVSVSATTGDNCSISIGQAVATSSSPTFAGLTINGAITATGDITAYYTSDKRHKNNIQIIPNALSKVRALNGVTWEWNDDVNEVTKSTPKTGLIAQEVQSVLPEVVIEKADGFLGLDYSKMMGLMVEAIKEQQLQIDKLTLKVAELEKQKGL